MAHFNWSPGIGDPTIAGWLTVALYLIALVSCWKTSRMLSTTNTVTSREQRAWYAISVAFLALGINKQLDLQTALTDIGRILAFSWGWYEQRQIVQLVFIILVAVLCVAALMFLLNWTSGAPMPTWMALIGSTFVLGFILIRAASFHHIDRFISERFLGIRWNWILEMGGITIVIIASEWRRRRLLLLNRNTSTGSGSH